jgi:hypothetical protein
MRARLRARSELMTVQPRRVGRTPRVIQHIGIPVKGLNLSWERELLLQFLPPR